MEKYQQDQLMLIREGIDMNIQLCVAGYPHAEVIMCKRHLEMAKGWAGKLLQFDGSPNPYPESTNPESDRIENTAATFEGELPVMPEFTNRIAYIKAHRGEIDKMISAMDLFIRSMVPQWGTEPSGLATHLGGVVNPLDVNKKFLAATQAWVHLNEAKMSLGLALGAIRDGKEAQAYCTDKPISNNTFQTSVDGPIMSGTLTITGTGNASHAGGNTTLTITDPSKAAAAINSTSVEKKPEAKAKKQKPE